MHSGLAGRTLRNYMKDTLLGKTLAELRETAVSAGLPSYAGGTDG